jgi:hypothetical protein
MCRYGERAARGGEKLNETTPARHADASSVPFARTLAPHRSSRYTIATKSRYERKRGQRVMDDKELAALPAAFDSRESRTAERAIVSVRLFLKKWPDYYMWIVRAN